MIHYGSTLLFILLIAMSGNGQSLPTNPPVVETGVSQTLAKARKQQISQLAYALKFDIPAQKNQLIPASETITFNWAKTSAPLQIDFKEERTHIQKVSVNGVDISIVFESEHVLISTAFLKPGANRIFIQFTAGNLSLNRNDDYLYTLLVPDRARTVFPCFDQPDLKATFQLSLTVPGHWQAMTNAAVKDSSVAGDRKTVNFQTSNLIPTYLFSFIAGRFTPVTRTLTGRPMTLLHRETDSTKIRLSLETLFKLHADALTFLEAYTQIPYPFQKFDFAAIPDFQYGGMEHVGAIDYRASALFLDNGATRDQRLARASVISHETAHMWFGDLVTMRWFNDVWLKEVFANFMADKITEVSSADANYDLQFVVDHFPAAYAVDRTEGANPIGQPLANLQEAGSMYGGIIYHKAPIMMRQLERLMGKMALRDGLRDYLKKYAFSNATWADLIAILDARTPTDLAAWNHVWVNETGRPKFSYQLDGRGGTIKQFVISQQGEDGSQRLWPQGFELELVYSDHIDQLTVTMDRPQVTLTQAIGKPTPQYIIFNSSGQGYGVFPIDSVSVLQLERIKNPVARASIYINLYENMLAGQGITPAQLATGYRSLLGKESEELNLRLLTSQLADLVWNFTRPENRPPLAASVEKEAWHAMEQETASGKKKLLFRLYQNIAGSAEAKDRLYAIWNEQKAPAGVTLTEDDYTSLALALAVRDYPVDGILEKQLARIKNPDRKKRLQFMMPALSSNVTNRDQFFASLANEANREREAWVVDALGYLHHPLRTETSAKYLRTSLELLEEIQKTGDIFFPERWVGSTFSAYQTPEVAKLVRTFLTDHPGYNARLRAKLLQAADRPFRASRLLYK
ncbi:aminopeptidase [Spirosoma sp. KCTC 42546]|uniref:M1 family aminopeptidase n=1 Tax=Spirosoma sp. KCTC 42546 TaxID=2520506 RepID=UPI0011578BE9|nr:M1 family aminopeptidase [Spirosoma sp. KCTC 42546]QDK81360.1 aminopeptidase [Spirosoma sp. KCTC 42546]